MRRDRASGMFVLALDGDRDVKSTPVNIGFNITQRSEFVSHITIGSGASLGAVRNCDSEESFMGHPLLDLANKTAVGIGGTRGIGAAIAPGPAHAVGKGVPAGRPREHV